MRSTARRGLAESLDDVRRAGLLTALPRLLVHRATLSGVIASSARRWRDHTAIVDHRGALTYRELDELVTAASRQIARGDRVLVTSRSGRETLVAAAAAIRAGADAVMLGPDGSDIAKPHRGRGRLILLTSGTTGEPTAPRRAPLNPLTVSSLLAAIGLREGERVLVLPPVHHGHGLSLTTACLMLGAPAVLGGGLELDEQVALARDAGVISGVPTQLWRLAGHAAASSLSPRRIVSGSGRLSPILAARLHELYGPVLVDFFGTTAVGTVTIATAADLAEAPGTVGRPAAGVRVSIRDGLVHVNGRRTGDRGYLDDAGRLFLTGRSDDLIVSGRENLSPTRVEDYLAAHPGVADVHVRAVPDEEYGHRLVARVVLRPGFDEPTVLAHVSRDLGRHAVPRLERVEKIERTATGKVKLVAPPRKPPRE